MKTVGKSLMAQQRTGSVSKPFFIGNAWLLLGFCENQGRCCGLRALYVGGAV
jgi:hypothetical protein